MDDSLSQDEIDALLNAMSSEQNSASASSDEVPQPILSQNEIDSLLSVDSSPQVPFAGNSGGILAGFPSAAPPRDANIEKYDFTMPSRVSRDHLRSLRTLHSSYAQSLSSAFSITLRSVVEVTCIHIEQLSYGEYLASLLDPSCIGVFNMNPMKGYGVIEINPLLVFPIIDRMLGGPGATRLMNRAFTAIEGMLIKQVMEDSLKMLQEAWHRNIKLDIKLERLEDNPQFIQAASASDPVILILFDVLMSDIHSMMSLCFPFLTIQQALASLRREEYPTLVDDDTAKTCKEMVHSHMLEMKIPLSARYEASNVSLGELLGLQKGDIIRLPNASSEEVMIFAGGQPKFSGKPGMSNGRRAIQIISEEQ